MSKTRTKGGFAPVIPPKSTASTPTWRDRWHTYAPRLRYWLLTLAVLVVVAIPLWREGLPLTQLGFLPANPPVAPQANSGLSLAGTTLLGWKGTLTAWAVVTMLFLGLVANRLWRAHGWWVAALGAATPLTVTLLYQRGTPILFWVWALLLVGVVLFALMRGMTARAQPVRLALLLGGVAVVLGLSLWLVEQQPSLDPYQLFLAAWADPADGLAWVGAPSYQVGVVPIVLGVLVVLAALPRRHEPTAQVALGLVGASGLFIALTLLPGPVMVWLIVAVMLLMLAAGALPVLDPRYATLPVQIGILAIAVLTIYPYLRPAWLPTVPTDGTSAALFGRPADQTQLWLVNADTRRNGDDYTVEVWWQSVNPRADYTAFVHFVDANGNVIAQADTLLTDGNNVTTSGWSRGYVVQQTYQATVTTPVTDIRFGLYDLATQQRLFSESIGAPADSLGTDYRSLPLPTAP